MKFPKLSFKMRSNFISSLIVVAGVVLVWRGLWNLMDIYFFPGEPLISNSLGILAGLILLYLPDDDIKELL